MALLLVLLVLVFGMLAPTLAFLTGLRLGRDRERLAASAADRRDLLDRMERAEISGHTALLGELSQLYRDTGPPHRR